MKIFVMRHGQTVWNARGITQGISQNRLSSEGKIQTEKSAEFLKDKKIDYIVCSPLMRTVQTANIMNKFHNARVVKNEKIIEVNQGIFTGRIFKTLTEEERFIKSQRSKLAGMESIEEVLFRVHNFIEELKNNYAEKSVLVVTHNLVAGAIEAVSKNEKFDEKTFRENFNFKNAEIKELEI